MECRCQVLLKVCNYEISLLDHPHSVTAELRPLVFMLPMVLLRKPVCPVAMGTYKSIFICGWIIYVSFCRDPLCHCGYAFSAHSSKAVDNQDDGTTNWFVHQHTEAVPTNAYGDLEFTGHGQKQSKVRITNFLDLARN